MSYLVNTSGEWVTAASFLGLAFLVAVVLVVLLGYWVLRGDRRNRAYQERLLEGGSESAGAAEAAAAPAATASTTAHAGDAQAAGMAAPGRARGEEQQPAR